jgi:uncharacterized protein
MSWKPKTTECCIGIVGPSWSGKTVFLTSLINHLQHQEPSLFPFGKKGTRIRQFTELPTEYGWPPFPYSEFRNRIVNRVWPAKTTDRAQYACRFERTDWNFTDVIMRFYDLPGERINDIAMVQRYGDSYESWSDHVIQRLRNDIDYLDHFTNFFKHLDNPHSEEMDIVRAYRIGLARLWLAYKPYLTPSTFQLDLKGTPCKGTDPEVIARERHSGLSDKEEFVPLPADVRAKRPDLVAKFSERFLRYRDGVVAPWVDALKSCHGLVVMVDVLEILAAGHGMYNDIHALLKDLFQTLRLDNNPLKRTLGTLSDVFLPHFMRPAWVKRVAFVAPKADRAHPRDRMNIGRLLHELTRKFADDLDGDGITCQTFRVASVVSTEMHTTPTNERKLLGSTLYDAQGKRLAPGEKHVFSVSPVPENWPKEWKQGEFVYPEVYPDIPARMAAVPMQEGLAEVFDFLCW